MCSRSIAQVSSEYFLAFPIGHGDLQYESFGVGAFRKFTVVLVDIQIGGNSR